MTSNRFLGVWLFCCLTAAYAVSQTVEYIPFSQAEPVLNAYLPSLPSDLKPFGKLSADEWSNWARQQDKNVRGRLEQGQDDALTNLLRLGTSFTKQPRITGDLLEQYGKSNSVNDIADKRADDLIAALMAPHLSPDMLEMRNLLQKRGYRLTMNSERQRLKGYLLGNLGRLRTDIMRADAQAKVNRNQALIYRGISTDSTLFPDYLLDEHLQRMLHQRLLKPGSIHRIAIVGPGMEYVNEDSGTDIYPPQVTQPFAVIDTLARLGLADPDHIEVLTFDISPRVNSHINRARKAASAGGTYTIHLLSTPPANANKSYVSGFVGYCEGLGKAIAAPLQPKPVTVPSEMKDTVCNRAITIRPAIVNEVVPFDMDVIFQTMELPADKQFDLIIATNVLDYYGDLDQSLARMNLGSMLKPGGFLLTTESLPDTEPKKLASSVKTVLAVALTPKTEDYMYTYVRK